VELLDRLLGHDAWTTAFLLERCRELSDADLDRRFDIDHGCARTLLEHLIGNVEVWTDLLLDRPVRPRHSGAATLDALTTRHTAAYEEFALLARRITDAGRLDETWLDRLDDPPTPKSYGGAIAHVITHDMHHRAHLLLVLSWLGLTGLPEGDVLGWELGG